MTAPRPGFLSGFGPTFLRALGVFFRSKKAIILLLVLAVPPLLTLPGAGRSPQVRGESLMAILIFLYLQFVLPVSGLLFGMSILQEEESAGNLPYLFTRPVPRSSILLAKFAASVLVGWVLLLISLGVTFSLSAGAQVDEGLPGRAALAVVLALPAYVAIFTFLSCLTRWALITGFFYAFGLEGFMTLIPGMVRRTTLLYYTRSLLGDWEARKVTTQLIFGKVGNASASTSVTVLLVVAGVGLALAAVRLARRQFVPRISGRE